MKSNWFTETYKVHFCDIQIYLTNADFQQPHSLTPIFALHSTIRNDTAENLTAHQIKRSIINIHLLTLNYAC